MAGIGLSKLIVYKYTNSGGTVTYSDKTILGKAVSLDLELDEGSDNNLYADNAIAESENTFTSGSLTISTDNLAPEVMATILGVTGTSATSVTGAKFYNFNDLQNAPYFGLAVVRKLMVNGVIGYKTYYYEKIQFVNMNESMQTQGETIEWQTPEITAKLMRSDATNHGWGGETSVVSTEDNGISLADEHFGYEEPEDDSEGEE